MALSDRLNSPIKRIGFVCMTFGGLLFAASIIGYIARNINRGYSYGLYSDWFLSFFEEAALFEQWYYWYQILGGIGFWTLLMGAIVAFFYDQTIGRIALWIRFGSLKKP